MNIAYSKAGYSRGEPFPIHREEPTLISKMLNFHLKELRYSVSELAKLLLMREDELRQTYLPRKRLELVVSR
jgi:hypothetical protein